MTSTHEQDKYNVLKVDLDIKPPAEWITEWIETREIILSHFALEVKKVRYVPTKHGWHFWFHIDLEVNYDSMMMLQFMLGDDHNRCYFGLQRKGFKRFRGLFNLLFDKKRKIGEDE